VAWQSDKLESANFLKFEILQLYFLAFLVHPARKQLAIRAELWKFVAG